MENSNWLEYCKSLIPQMKERYKKMMGFYPNIENPKRFTEKLEWLKVYDSTFLKTYCSDKITVREYVKNKIGEDISIPIIGIYDKFDDIDFSKLPKDYVIKTNHGSHTNIIVKNNNIDKTKARNKFNEWISKDWSWWGYEMHYKMIPRKIFIEKYISNLIDYKFYCFNGEIGFAQVDRHEKERRINYYTKEWKQIDWISNNMYPNDLNVFDEIPMNYNKMLDIVNILCKDFKFVRVDLYNIYGKIYFGELTFIPGASYIKYSLPETDFKIGRMLNLC